MTNSEMEKHGLTEEGRKYAEMVLVRQLRAQGWIGEIAFEWLEVKGQLCVRAYNEEAETPALIMSVRQINQLNRGSE